MNLGMMKRRFSVREKQPDIYEGCVTLEFTETVDSNVRPITANNNNAINYLDYIIIDGVEITPTKYYQHTFGIGSHKIGWKFKTTIIYASVLACTAPSGNAIPDNALVTIPSQITEIKSMAMRGLPAYSPKQGVICYAVNPPTAVSLSLSLWYISASNGNYIKVPSGSVDAYKAAEGWSIYANRIIAI